MSIPEYDQRAEDHRSILLLIRSISDCDTSDSGQQFERIFEKIARIEEIKIKEPNLGYERTVRLRFKKDEYETSNNEWGDFQAHRRLFGVITFGQLKEAQQSNKSGEEVEELYDQHLKAIEPYPGLYDSRCFLVRKHAQQEIKNGAKDQLDKESSENCIQLAGLSSSSSSTHHHHQHPFNKEDLISDKSSIHSVINETELPSSSSSASYTLLLQANNDDDDDHEPNNNNDDEDESGNNSLCSTGSKQLANCVLHETDSNLDERQSLDKLIEQVEQELQGMVASIFYVLESKRLDKSFEKQERIPLLMAPFENKSLIGLDTDNKQQRKKSMARMRKHIGDLCLLIGSPGEALTNYSTAIEMLRTNQDLLWLSGALEGQCVASLSLLYPTQSNSNDSFYTIENGHSNGLSTLKKRSSLQRIFSLPSNKFRLNSTGEGRAGTPETVAGDQTPSNQGSSSASTSSETNDNNLMPSVDQNDATNQSTPSGTVSNTTSGSVRSARSNLTKRFVNTTSNNTSKSLPNGLDPIMTKMLGKSLLSTPEEIYDKYKEACCHYAKFKTAAVIELECSFKAARVLATRERYLLSSEFIQNAVFILCNQNSDEQIKRLSVIASLYEDIGFRRKAAFYRRFSALKTISSSLEKENWQRCYYLLLPALSGYHLTLDPLEFNRRFKQKDFGWIGIHVQLLQELATMARRMNCEQLTQRHLSFLLQCLFEQLAPAQRSELSKQLLVISSRCGEDSPVPLQLNNGIQVPCVSMTKFPMVSRLEVKNTAQHLRPYKIKGKHRESLTNSTPSSPFIFTPMQMNRPFNARRKSYVSSQSQTIEFQWVQNELCYVHMEVYNLLPNELVVNHMALMTSDSLPFETMPISMKLPPESNSPISFQLCGRPKEHGKLELFGYSLHVLGVKNICRFNELPAAKRLKLPSKYIVDVIPALPLLNVTFCESLPDSRPNSEPSSPSKEAIVGESFSPEATEDKQPNDTRQQQTDGNSCSVSLRLYAGESKVCRIRLTNESTNGQLIELVSAKVISKLAPHLQDELIKFELNELYRNLPFEAGQSIEFDVRVFAQADFTMKMPQSNLSAPQSRADSPQSSSTTTTKKQPNSIGSTLVNFLSDLQSTPKASRKFSQQVTKVTTPPPAVTFPTKKYEFSLEFEYSGGAGLAAGYCRKSLLNFSLEIISSLLITQWDVLPAEVPTHCYLVFDVLNATAHEMELQYSANKSIVIESKETCRIPVPVQRCPLSSSPPSISFSPSSPPPESSPPSQNRVVKHDLHLLCKQHLKEQVQLTWNLNQLGDKRQGTASTANIAWTSQMLNSILKSSLSWKVFINEMPMDEWEEIRFKIGQVVSLKVELSNCSGWSIKYLNLMFDCYQDYMNGSRKYNLGMKRGMIGKDRIHIDELVSNQTFVHECRYVFFYSGIYKLDLHCNGTEQVDHQVITTGVLQDSTNNNNNNNMGQSSQWSFLPTIEMNIVE